MKKIIKTLIIILLSMMLFACDNKKQEVVEPTIQNTEEVVSIADFVNLLNPSLGKWTCPSQFSDYYLEFYNEDGKYYLNQRTTDFEKEEDTKLISEIGSITYNKDNKTYTVNLLEANVPLKYDVLHVDASKINEGYIKAENIYDNNAIVEYVFIEEEVVETTSNLYYSKWQLRTSDVAEEYIPYVEFDEAGMFTFIENTYAGMGSFTGSYEITETGYKCYVDKANNMQGFAGQDTKLIEFTKISDTILQLETSICMSEALDIFDLVP